MSMSSCSGTYNVSASLRVQQLETELSTQLEALRTEIAENGCLQGATAKSYCSVQIPKDISYFRAEREQTLKRLLQVPAATPLVSQAEITQHELQSCISREYTPESLPLLLHQHYLDRAHQLALCKHLLMLRWRRFCRHSTVLERLFPFYKDQMHQLMQEYEDAVQRARRLAVTRERLLTNSQGPNVALSQDDVVIYLQWLVTHLHSLKTVHSFLQVLHYLPVSERKHTESPASQVDSASPAKQFAGVSSANGLPVHVLDKQQFQSQLQHLLSHFQLQANIQDIRTPAEEMELFRLVSQEFGVIFKQQQEGRALVQYDSTEAVERQLGRRSCEPALRKEANWIPFIQIRPKIDPWQQKSITKLKEQNFLDELLRNLSKSCWLPDPDQAVECLKQHTYSAMKPESVEHSSGSRNSQIWTNLYNSVPTPQDSVGKCSASSLKKPKLGTNTERLGFEEYLGDGDVECSECRGAYLSLVHLRYLRIRELQDECLNMQNYMRSVERTLTFDLAAVVMEGGELRSRKEEWGWMSAMRRDVGGHKSGSIGSHHQIYSTPADYQVHCSEFMEFPEVENHHDYYSGEGRGVRTQDQRGLFVVYDAALEDLQELEHTLLLTASNLIQTWSTKQCVSEAGQSRLDLNSWASPEVDRLAVLLDLWTCEAAFMENKMQLLNCYFEAYQHVTDCGERLAMAQVITDIMHRRPRLPQDGYLVQAYHDEMACLQTHQQLIKHILDRQIEEQRCYLRRVWRRGGGGAAALGFGLPPDYTPKQPVTLCGGSPALKSVHLLEVHPSLYQAQQVYQALNKAHAELCQLTGAKGASEQVALEQRVLKRALHYWHTQASLGASYGPQIQKDLFSEVFFEDPLLLRDVGLSVLRSAENKEFMSEKDRQLLSVETFSKLLEVVTVRHRLLEAAVETEYLAQLYKALAVELGYEEFHLYLRPVQFEFAVMRDIPEQRPMFITAILEDNFCVDRYAPSSLPLAIQELDANHIGRFSFHSQEAVIQLLSGSELENLQVALACQVTHKHALTAAIKQASLCYWAEAASRPQEVGLALPWPTGRALVYYAADPCSILAWVLCRPFPVSLPKWAEFFFCSILKIQDQSESKEPQDTKKTSSRGLQTPVSESKHRLAGSFVSLQLEKTRPRDEMLNAYIKRREATGTLMQNLEEAAKVKRKLILEFCSKFSASMSQYCIRAQIVALYHSLSSLLREFPAICQTHFMMGQPSQAKSNQDAEKTLRTDPRRLLSADGTVLLNLWFLPHYAETLLMFRDLAEKACQRALEHTLEIASALHDIVCYSVTFARLGSSAALLAASQSTLTADWGGTESISTELWNLQQQVDSLGDHRSPKVVGHLLQLRRQVLFLLFDAATRHTIRKTFLSTGNIGAYQSVSDNMGHALPLLSDRLTGSEQSCGLPLPQPLDPHSPQAQRLFPWRWFVSRHGRHPLDIWDVPPIEYCMQLCVSGLGERSRQVANGELLGVSLLLEEVLSGAQVARPLQLDTETRRSKDADADAATQHDNVTQGLDDVAIPEDGVGSAGKMKRDPAFVLEQQRGFLLLWKQLEVLKECWGCHRLGVQQIHSTTLYRHFNTLYRQEIQLPSMRALAQQLGCEQHYEAMLLLDSQALLPPAGASEVQLKTWELMKLLESTECDMIKAVQWKMAKEMTLLMSERARQDTALPTDVWKRGPMKHCPTPERPLVVENFAQQLLSGGQISGDQVTFSSGHLQECLNFLLRDVIGRERSNFLFYSQFYEHLLQLETQLLHQREQDVKNLEENQILSNDPLNKVTGVCRGLMVEVTALRCRLVHLEEEHRGLRQQLTLQHRQHYDTLVRQLLTTCLQLKSRLDGYHQKMEEDVLQMVGRVRREGVDKITKLQKKYDSSRDPKELADTLVEKEMHLDLLTENSQQRVVMRKLQTLAKWREATALGKLQRELLTSKQRELCRQLCCMRVQMESEQQGALQQQELEALRVAMETSQREVHITRKQLSQQSQRLQEVQHSRAQEKRMRGQLQSSGQQSLQRLQEEAEERERLIKQLTEQLSSGRRHSQLQQQHSTKELQQVRSKLQQERGLKQEAFQLVSQLQRQVSSGGGGRSLLSCSASTPV
ncbi:uncharacterized protein si:ch73-242m19.1 [Engraulis encrasicolus]|uniref:uncharacterized protein si:ch73-242m19.1 n=1 Tax=Engraulis encrasicolus TaxID=184585 RepID=UPI002FD1EE84